MAPTDRDVRWVAEEFDRRAATYDGSALHRWQAEHAARLLNPQPGQRILDVATGTGLGIRAAAHLAGPDTYWVGIDVSQRMLQIAQQQSTSARHGYLVADAHQLPFRAAVFQAILCVAAVPYLRDLPQAVAEWRRVTQPNAVAVFTTPAADGLTINRLLREAAAVHGITVPDPHEHLGTDLAVRHQARQLGGVVEAVVRHTFPDPLRGSPEDAFEAVINYGFAESLRAVPPSTRQLIFQTYRQYHFQTQRAQQGSQDWIFTRWRLP